MFRLRAALASRLRLHLVQAMSRKQLDNFLRLLKASPSGAVFNPWWQIDEENDIGRTAPAIRQKTFSRLFSRTARQGKARRSIGEALGYRGGHFSGIPMTSERMLLGKQPDDGIVARTRFFQHQATPHEQTKCLSGWFFGTDSDDCLGRVAEDLACCRTSSSCGMRFRGIHSIHTAGC